MAYIGAAENLFRGRRILAVAMTRPAKPRRGDQNLRLDRGVPSVTKTLGNQDAKWL
jgi:hypothetical protein